MKHQVDENKITVSGIPIRSGFYQFINKEVILNKYEVSHSSHVVTILAGAQGVLKNVKQLAERLLQDPSLTIIVICGKNNDLYEKLLPTAVQYPETFRLFGYVEELHEILKLSHCLITKPGGITITEAAALNLPLILYKPVPGQESENAKHFQSHGAALIAESTDEIAHCVQRLFHNKQLLAGMKTALKCIHQPVSSQKIVHHALQGYQKLKA